MSLAALKRGTVLRIVSVIAVLAGSLAVLSQPAAASVPGTSQFKGVNWADPRDNYASGPVVPTGLSTSDSYSTTYTKASAIISGFQSNLGANTVRLPIN